MPVFTSNDSIGGSGMRSMPYKTMIFSRLCTTSLGLIGLLLLSRTLAPAADTPAVNSSTSIFIGAKAGQMREDNSLKMKLVWCPPGKFSNGQSRR